MNVDDTRTQSTQKAGKSLREGLLIFFLVFVVIPATLFGYMFMRYHRDAMLQTATESNLRLAQAITNNVEGFLDGPVRLARHEARRIVEMKGVPAAQIELQVDSIIRSFGYFESIFVVDKGGVVRYVGTSNDAREAKASYRGITLSHVEQMSQAAREQRHLWSDTFISPITGKPTISLTVPYVDGAVVCNINLTYLAEIVQSALTSTGTRVFIANAKGRFIAHPDAAKVLQQQSARGLPVVRDALAGAMTSAAYDHEGMQVLGSVTLVTQTGWLVVVEQEMGDALRHLRTMEGIYVVSLILILMLFVMTVFYVSLRIIRPILFIGKSMRQVAVGTFTPIRHTGAARELDELCTDINTMIDAVRTREEQLMLGERNYRDLVEHANSAILRWDTDGIVTYFNEFAEHLFGYTKDEIIGRSLFGTIVPDSDTRGTDLHALIRNIVRHPERYGRNENENITKDGRRLWMSWANRPIFDDSGELVGILSVGQDITDRMRTEDALRKSESRLRSIIETTGEGFCLIDMATRTIIDVNSVICTMLGYARDEVLGKPLLDFLDDENRAVIMKQFELALTTDHRSYDLQLLTRSGRSIPVHINAATLRDESGRPVSSFAFIADITEQLRAAADREQLSMQLQQAQKIESIGRLAGGVAHDFNNLLTPVIGYAELVRDSLDPATKNHGRLEAVLEAARKAQDLTRQLLAFSRKQTLEMRTVDLNEVLTSFSKILRRTIRENIEIEIREMGGLWSVRADPAQIEQIIMNLAVNAQDAIADVGQIAFETANTALDESYCTEHPGVSPGEYVMLSVSDTGSGMDAETQRRIFEPFFTTKEQGRGTGLGLATVYGIVKQHGGGIWVYSEPGEGTVFKIYLPRDITPGTIETKTSPMSAGIRGAGVIMLVEDNDMVRQLAQQILIDYGYEVLSVGDTDEAVELFRREQARIDLLFTDVVMPKMDGPSLHAELVKIKPGLRVLYTSGYTGNALARHGITEEGLHFLHKPFNVRSLTEKVAETLRS